MSGDPGGDRSLFGKVVRAAIEGMVTAFLFTGAVLVIGTLLGMGDQLAGRRTGTIIALCGALGLLLSGRLSVSRFEDR